MIASESGGRGCCLRVEQGRGEAGAGYESYSIGKLISVNLFNLYTIYAWLSYLKLAMLISLYPDAAFGFLTLLSVDGIQTWLTSCKTFLSDTLFAL